MHDIVQNKVIKETDKTIERALGYMAEVAGITFNELSEVHVDLPPFLSRQYRLYSAVGAPGRVLLIRYVGAEVLTPARYTKQLPLLLRAAPDYLGACLVVEELPYYVRRRLARRNVAFVVPAKQLNWPEMGIAFQKQAWSGVRAVGERMLPATQLLVLYGMTYGIPEPVSARELSRALSYSAMTISRALDQLEVWGVGHVERTGRERLFSLPESRSALWSSVVKVFQSPVMREIRIFTDGLSGVSALPAGETALAAASDLAAPVEPTYAVSASQWKSIKDSVTRVPVADEDTCLLQIWRYDPAFLSGGKSVDPYSLWLSLSDNPDERVQAALEGLLSGRSI